MLSPVEAPAWAGACGSIAVRHHCRPSPSEYRAFFTALGTRYSGSFNGLPRVSRWSVWNEPNQSNWLYPQRERVHGHIVPTAAIIYRNLFRGASSALKATGHGGDQLLLGETAPLGRTTGPLPKRFLTPVEFYQGVFCLDSRGHKLRGSIAKAEGCSGRFAKLAATGIAHHPYNRGGAQPPLSKPAAGEVTISTIPRLTAVLAQGSRARRISSNLPIFFTEFGFQTNPPDRISGVSPAKQAAYINQSDYIAYRNSRVKSVSQYELLDEADLGSFQTGLRFVDGSPKPSLDAYRLPIWVIKHGSGVTVWGQVRPGHAAAGADRERQRHQFTAVKTVRPAAGYFLVNLPRQPKSSWLWQGPGGTFTSRVAARPCSAAAWRPLLRPHAAPRRALAVLRPRRGGAAGGAGRVAAHRLLGVLGRRVRRQRA